MSKVYMMKVGWKYHQVGESALPLVVELCQRCGFNNFKIEAEQFSEGTEDTYELEAWRNE